MSDTHYNIDINVTKVEFKPTRTTGASYGGRTEQVTQEKRVVSEAGHVNIKHVDFAEAKRLAGAHLDLLTEFGGTDPKHGRQR
jgi:hypothetical protein